MKLQLSNPLYALHSYASQHISRGTAISLILHISLILISLLDVPTISKTNVKKIQAIHVIAPVADKINLPPSNNKQANKQQIAQKLSPTQQKPQAKQQATKTIAAATAPVPAPVHKNQAATTAQISQKKPSEKTSSPAETASNSRAAASAVIAPQHAPKNAVKNVAKAESLAPAVKPKPSAAPAKSAKKSPQNTIKADNTVKSSAAKNQKAASGTSALKSINQEAKNTKNSPAPSKSIKTKKSNDLNILNDIMNEVDFDNYDETKPLSTTELQLIMTKIHQSWNVTSFSGASNAAEVTVTLKVTLGIYGQVLSIEAKPNYKYLHTNTYNAMLKSAIKAVHDAAPFTSLPKDKYMTWKNLELLFDPQNML